MPFWMPVVQATCEPTAGRNDCVIRGVMFTAAVVAQFVVGQAPEVTWLFDNVGDQTFDVSVGVELLPTEIAESDVAPVISCGTTAQHDKAVAWFVYTAKPVRKGSCGPRLRMTDMGLASWAVLVDCRAFWSKGFGPMSWSELSQTACCTSVSEARLAMGHIELR